jgi:hypothetical protein
MIQIVQQDNLGGLRNAAESQSVSKDHLWRLPYESFERIPGHPRQS